MADVLCLAKSRGPSHTHVIFLHGLGGHPRQTWQAAQEEATLWPLWLAKDIDGHTIWSIGYEAPVSRWQGHAMHLVSRATNILGELYGEPEFRDGRIILIGHSLGGLDKAYLGTMGVRIALQGHQPFSAAVQAVYDTLKALRDGTKPADLTGIASSATMARVTREGDYKTWTEKFMT